MSEANVSPSGAPPAARPSAKLVFRWARWLGTFAMEGWPSMLFSASLVLILEHLGLFTGVSKLSLLLVSNLAAHHGGPPPDFSQGPYVVAITEADFQDRYRERSPLDHCLVADDLQRVLSQRPQRLAVDIDLSPPSAPSAAELACQQRLDALLDAHAGETVLITPEPVASGVLRQAKLDWMQARCAAGVRFASPYLERSLRVVIDQRARAEDSLAFMARDGEAPSLCRELQADPATFATAWLDSAGPAHRDPPGERQPINFAVAAGTVPAPLPLADPQTWPSLRDRVVFFGGTWGRDDTYTTPIGPQPGVWIHAARLVTLDHPVHSLPQLVGFVIDLVTGFAFALLICGFWKLYIGLRIVELEEEPRPAGPVSALGRMAKSGGRFRSSWSSLTLFNFVLAYALLCLSFFFVARYLFLSWAMLISPLLMAVGMLSDGFMSGPVEVLTERVGHERAVHAGATSAAQRRWLRRWAMRVLGLVLLALAGFVLLVLGSAHAGKALTIGLGIVLATLLLLVVLGVVRSLLAGHEAGASDHVQPLAKDAPDEGWDRVIAGFGRGVGALRLLIFWMVVAYAFWILCVH